MRLSKSLIIALKDFKIFSRKKNVLYSLVAVPLIVSILLPVIITSAGHKGGATGMTAAELMILLPSFTFLYLVLAGVIPTTIASYSLVGEKVEKSLEPLLATPTTDSEILLGKGIAAFLPAIGAILVGATIMMTLMDLFTHKTLGYNFFPNLNASIVLFLMVPMAAILSVEWNVVVSSRVSDIRVAQQIGVLMVLPLGGLYLLGELDVVSLGDTSNLLIIAGILVVLDLLFLYIAKATFRRDEILTKWK